VGSVRISPATATLDPGATARFTAEIRQADGSLLPGVSVGWSTSSPGIATVDSAGSVRAVAGGIATVTALAGGQTGTATVHVRDVYDLDARGVPAILTHGYIDPGPIQQISRFRSGVGHDYADSVESCRSMKHYFMPFANADWSSIAIFAPASGIVTDIKPETTFGSQVQIAPAALTAMTIVIFHVVPDGGITVGASVTAGQRLGRHVGSQTMSDVAVRIETPGGSRLVSYFDALTDAAFDVYRARGATREALVLPRADRDANPLTCTGEQFQGPGTLGNWVFLN